MKDNIRRIKTAWWTTITMLLALSSSYSIAGEKEDFIIDKAVNAYGGDKLLNLQSIQLKDKMMAFNKNQSGHSAQGPMATHLSEYHIEMTIDFHNERKMLNHKTIMLVGYHDVGNETITHQFFANDEGYVIDHVLKRYQLSKRINFQNADNGFAQMIDTLIIKQLDKEKKNSQWLDTAYIQGQANDVLMVNKGTKDQYTVYINQQTGHLSRLLLRRGEETRSYDFLQHLQTQGLTWAKQVFVATQEKPVYHTNSRTINFNTTINDSVILPKDYTLKAPAKWIDDSKLSIRELSKGIYFVGQNWGYTLFIDTGEQYISAGAWHYGDDSKAWKNALALLRKTTGDNKPIVKHLVSHHHTDHMSGLKEIIKQGAELILHPTDIKAVNNYLPQSLPQNRFISFNGPVDTIDEKVILFDVPNSHASHNLVIYLPEEKILFSEDMFGSSYHSEFHSPSRWPDMDTYPRLKRLTDKVSQLGIKVEKYVSSHHYRILTQTEIDEALKIKRL